MANKTQECSEFGKEEIEAFMNNLFGNKNWSTNEKNLTELVVRLRIDLPLAYRRTAILNTLEGTSRSLFSRLHPLFGKMPRIKFSKSRTNKIVDKILSNLEEYDLFETEELDNIDKTSVPDYIKGGLIDRDRMCEFVIALSSLL